MLWYTFTFDIWGDTVNTALMEQNSEPGKINVSETTHFRIQKHVDSVERGIFLLQRKVLENVFLRVLELIILL